MRLRSIGLCLLASAWLAVACSGKLSPSEVESGPGGSGGGTGGWVNDAGGCPSDLKLMTGVDACQALSPGCVSGYCMYGEGTWTCSLACPCPEGWRCVDGPGKARGCVPERWADCLAVTDAGAGGAAGAGGSGHGGAGGWAGGAGGSSGAGGAGGSAGGAGGTGPCGGLPSCPGNIDAKFCQDSILLECTAGQSCPAPSSCKQYCPTCTCHVAPPINGLLNAGCDTCMSSADCASGLQCAEDPMLQGSGAKACVMK